VHPRLRGRSDPRPRRYRATHAGEAPKRYGADPKKVGDGMDTWHWWCGVDNPQFWRKTAVLAAKNYNVTNVHQDFLRLLHTTPRAERWDKIGLINDPDCVPAEKPDQYGLMLDRMKDGSLTWDPEVFGYSTRGQSRLSSWMSPLQFRVGT
jgi:hypothetical protein